MSITTAAGLISGLKNREGFLKTAVIGSIVGRIVSLYLATPNAAAASAPGIGGAAITSFTGQLPFQNPASGNSYLANLVATSSSGGRLLVLDRLWDNSGIDVTSTGSQTINSAAWPARDRNGSTNGEDVFIAMEVMTVMGAGTPTITMGFTDSDNNSGLSITTAALAATMAVGSFIPIELAAGCKGVRSIQTWQQSATMTSGAYALVAYRVLASLDMQAPRVSYLADYLDLGMPQLFDNTSPFLAILGAATQGAGGFQVLGSYQMAQG